MKSIKSLLSAILLMLITQEALAQDFTIATVTRPPFSMVENGVETGFSIDLITALMAESGQSFEIIRTDSFAEMLSLVETGEADAAAANISITAEREAIMDFTQPIFGSGLQIMTHSTNSSGWGSVFAVFASGEVLFAILFAFGLLLGGGMLMWLLERKHQPYFDLAPGEATFPAFWWALNLIVNGGFEERVPRSPLGRILGIFMVLSSLFFVSVFVAKITAALTINAIQSTVTSVNDLYDQQVGTIEGSTASAFLSSRDIAHIRYSDLDSMLEAFEANSLNAVVFDAPILAYYIAQQNDQKAGLTGRVFMPENYGIALPAGSTQAEQLNRGLLRLRENGTYEEIREKWFGIAS
ncbi:transporter substrate-binding domain-containing protein [Cochlodiniinecator piscidefendens]|uniref:transporter substrate-binding domain-containing protein n=1 Tax=Cochlodiniinecator piscidefendens TaxID=2715756 RepID=UPI00140D8864|nr:transporter substrate-binding domain-containing protein [Cochlodiniinecator piscidefendens]